LQKVKTVKTTILLVAAGLLSTTAPAFAQNFGRPSGGNTYNNTYNVNRQFQFQQQRQFQQQQAIARSNSNATASATGGSAVSNATGGNVVNNVLGGGGGRRNRYPAASAYAPSVAYGGANECGSQFSAGVQTFGFGFSLGIPIEQTQCTYRANAYAVTNISGSRTAGMLVLAQEPGMRAALAGAGLIVEPTYDAASGQWVYPQAVRRVSYGHRKHVRRSRCGRCG